jgi:hypothetical protein
VDGSDEFIRMSLTKFEKYIIDCKMENGEDDNLFFNNEEKGSNSAEAFLTETEITELESLIKEKKGDIIVDKKRLAERLKDFIEKNKNEEFTRQLVNRVHLIDDRVRKIEFNTQINQDTLNEMLGLNDEIIALIMSNWEAEMKIFKGEIEFNEEERKLVEKLKIKTGDKIKEWRKDYTWDNFPKGRIDQHLEIQILASLMKSFTKRSWFVGREEEVAEFIVKNRNK